jgi:hypothetical protein
MTLDFCFCNGLVELFFVVSAFFSSPPGPDDPLFELADGFFFAPPINSPCLYHFISSVVESCLQGQSKIMYILIVRFGKICAAAYLSVDMLRWYSQYFKQIVVVQVFGFFHCGNYPGKNGKKLSRKEQTNHLVHLFKNTPSPILDKLIYLMQGKVGHIIKEQRWRQVRY